jgi:hypothetical protein
MTSKEIAKPLNFEPSLVSVGRRLYEIIFGTLNLELNKGFFPKKKIREIRSFLLPTSSEKEVSSNW